MSCKECEENPVCVPYRWKIAIVDIIGCKEHVTEVINALNKIQLKKEYKEKKKTEKKELDFKEYYLMK